MALARTIFRRSWGLVLLVSVLLYAHHLWTSSSSSTQSVSLVPLQDQGDQVEKVTRNLAQKFPFFPDLTSSRESIDRHWSRFRKLLSKAIHDDHSQEHKDKFEGASVSQGMGPVLEQQQTQPQHQQQGAPPPLPPPPPPPPPPPAFLPPRVKTYTRKRQPSLTEMWFDKPKADPLSSDDDHPDSPLSLSSSSLSSSSSSLLITFNVTQVYTHKFVNAGVGHKFCELLMSVQYARLNNLTYLFHRQSFVKNARGSDMDWLASLVQKRYRGFDDYQAKRRRSEKGAAAGGVHLEVDGVVGKKEANVEIKMGTEGGGVNGQEARAAKDKDLQKREMLLAPPAWTTSTKPIDPIFAQWLPVTDYSTPAPSLLQWISFGPQKDMTDFKGYASNQDTNCGPVNGSDSNCFLQQSVMNQARDFVNLLPSTFEDLQQQEASGKPEAVQPDQDGLYPRLAIHLRFGDICLLQTVETYTQILEGMRRKNPVFAALIPTNAKVFFVYYDASFPTARITPSTGSFFLPPGSQSALDPADFSLSSDPMAFARRLKYDRLVALNGRTVAGPDLKPLRAAFPEAQFLNLERTEDTVKFLARSKFQVTSGSSLSYMAAYLAGPQAEVVFTMPKERKDWKMTEENFRINFFFMEEWVPVIRYLDDGEGK